MSCVTGRMAVVAWSEPEPWICQNVALSIEGIMVPEIMNVPLASDSNPSYTALEAHIGLVMYRG